MTLIPKSKTQVIIPKSKTQVINPKEKQSKLTKENYEKLKRLTGRGFSRIYFKKPLPNK